ncbi:MAG TPA: ABC transporter ATP-binding protein [Chloroflexota bacterium]|nr:ABC transporter ATP-binding protein [Chloroflexota bacterium]
MENADLLLQVTNLHTHFFLDQGVVKAVDGAHLTIRRGETLAVVGESGCGKSVTARSILQIVDPPGRVVAGEIRFWRPAPGGNGVVQSQPIDLARLLPSSREMRAIRGKEISMIFQEPMTSLSPLYTIGNQIAENITQHLPVSKREARERTVELLRQVGIPNPESRIDSYPHQLSGGLRQRAMIAMALACSPSLLIADEPTTALDVTTQAQILELLRDLQQRLGMAIMLITHDLGVVAEMADDVAVMYLGRVVETAEVKQLFREPQHPYTRALLRSIPKVGGAARERLNTIRGMVPDPFARPSGCPFHPRCDSVIPGLCNHEDPRPVATGPGRDVRCLLYTTLGVGIRDQVSEDRGSDSLSLPVREKRNPIPDSQPPVSNDVPLLTVEGLRMYFPIRRGLLQRVKNYVKAVDDVALTIQEGETLGLVGESGCGKTTVSRCVLRVYEPTDGAIKYRGADGTVVDLARADRQTLHPYRKEIRMIFQDPYSSLNPRMNVLQIIGEPLLMFNVAKGSELEDRVALLLKRVGLRPEYMRRYPHAFSGGERQRIGIARALSLNPRLVVCDEAVSALDVSVRAQILNLLQDFQSEFGLTYLFIAHDLSVVEYISDRVAVMYVGQVVELARTEVLYREPKHPYTEALLSAVPRPDPEQRAQRIVLQGDVADPANPPPGCYFHPRCRYVEARCKVERPALREIDAGHYAACHFAEKLTLRGAQEGDTKGVGSQGNVKIFSLGEGTQTRTRSPINHGEEKGRQL